MIAEVIAIGDELTSGHRLDTNSQWISQCLGELGVVVRYHSTAADEMEACSEVFRHAFARSDVVICTGGLGPTADDLTRDCLAMATGVSLELDEISLEKIRTLFRSRGREMPERNRVQAMFPAGSQPIPNPHGSAPGIAMKVSRADRDDCHLFALPGVPAEMIQMWEETVGLAIATLVGGGRVLRHRRIKCFGAGESHLEAMLPDLVRRGRRPSVGITVHQGTITLRISADGETEAACLADIEPTVETIRECLGTLVFGEEDEELENVLGRLLAERSLTLATLDWGTGGLLAHWLGNAVECDEHYLNGFVLGREDSAAPWLQNGSKRPAPLDSESSEVAQRLARAIRAQTGADYALATSRLPRVVDGKPPNGAFHVAIDSADGTTSEEYSVATHPSLVRPLAAKRALNLLRKKLIGQN